MKINLKIKIFWILFILTGCRQPTPCIDNICLKTKLIREGNSSIVELYLDSKIDTTLNMDQRMIVIGCPDYVEDYGYFKETPQLSYFKNSQILLENEDGEYRVYSSEFFEGDELKSSIMPNCAFVGSFKLELKKGTLIKYHFKIQNIEDLKVSKLDNKIRVSFVYKNYDSGGFILRSSNWIYL